MAKYAKKRLAYKDFTSDVVWDENEKRFRAVVESGEITGWDVIVHGKSFSELEQAFERAVDDILELEEISQYPPNFIRKIGSTRIYAINSQARVQHFVQMSMQAEKRKRDEIIEQHRVKDDFPSWKAGLIILLLSVLASMCK